MNGSLHIGRLFGIQVRLHVLWLIGVPLLLLMAPAAIPLSLALFAVVFLHELGHCLVAQSFGIRVLDITLWPLGGLARMSSIPEDSRVESLIALAGPAVNFALAALALGIEPFLDGRAALFAGQFFVINLLLGTFNLLPAFPLDGGRVLRAVLGRSGDWVRATERAVKVSRICAYVMVATGLFFLPASVMLIVVGLWILWVATQELMSVRLRHGLSPIGGFPMPGTGPGEAEAWFPGSAPAVTEVPVVDGDSAREERGERTEAEDVRARRPAAPAGPGRARRLSDEDLERLEGFRGPLREFSGE